jgi:rhamnosyltransferase
MQTALIVPTLNAGANWQKWLQALRLQTVQPTRVLVLDSESDDQTAGLAREFGHKVHVLKRDQFDHGGTRQLGAELCADAEILIFMTQDAILADAEALERLVETFAEPKVGAAFGRQLPRPEAGSMEAFSRVFSYPGESKRKSWDDRQQLKVRTTFISNSFAAYRRTALDEVAGFPCPTLICEDAIVAARMLMKGWDIMYAADAKVLHSHGYRTTDEFRRYFDIGAFHSREQWIVEEFGRAEGEGWRYVRAEVAYVASRQPWLLPAVGLRAAAKLVGYQLGYRHFALPTTLCRFLSMHRPYWDRVKSR